MTRETTSRILQLIHRVLVDPRLGLIPDQELVQRFIREKDEAAFVAILRRHGPMVLDVCRGVLANEADAEDAFQATFLVLARKAGSIRQTATLSSWLHGVAYRTALKARAESTRRRKHETHEGDRQVVDPDRLTWAEVRGVLHEELGQVSGRYREPLVLCYLQGKTQDVAAAELGLSKGTLKRRLERGRALLRARLVRRGVGGAAVLAISVWPATTMASLPSTVVVSTAKFALANATGQTAAGLIPPTVAALTEGVLHAMSSAMTKSLCGVILGLAIVGGVAGYLALNKASPQPELPGVELAAGAGEPKDEPPFVFDVKERSAIPTGNKDAGYAALQKGGTAMTRVGVSGEVTTWNLVGSKSGEPRRLPGRKAIGLSSDGRLAVMADSKQVAIVETTTGQKLTTFETAVGPDGQQPAEVRPVGGGPANKIPPEAYHPNFAVLSPDNQKVAVRCAGSIEVWSLAPAPKRTATFKLHAPLALAFTTDGKHLACVGFNHFEGLSVWELETQRRTLHVEAPREDVGRDKPFGIVAMHSVAFTPDGKTVIVGGEEHRRWNDAAGQHEEHRGWLRPFTLADGKEKWTAEFPPGKQNEACITTLAASHDSQIVAAASVGGSVKLYHVATGRELGEAKAGGGQFLEFTADGKELVVAGSVLQRFELTKRPLPVERRLETRNPKSEVSPEKPPLSTAAEQFQALEKEYGRLGQQASKAASEAKTDADRTRIFEGFRSQPQAFARRFLELAEKHPKDPAAIDALLWIVKVIGKGPEADKATEILLRDHWGHEKLQVLFQRETGHSFTRNGQAFLRTFAERGKDRETKGQALYKLARSLHAGAEATDRLQRDDSGVFTQQIKEGTPLCEVQIAYLKEQDSKRLHEEAIRLMGEVGRTYADVPDPFARRTLAEAVRDTLSEWKNPTVAVGKPALEIDGKDVEGKSFKLSDYRGKVVLLTFSGNWCGPCKQMYPHERELVERLKNKPFVAVSVNTDPTEEVLKESIRKGDITWRCWWDGGQEGPIATRWRIMAYPTIFVLDENGIIRFEGVRGKDLDRAIESLLTKLEPPKGKDNAKPDPTEKVTLQYRTARDAFASSKFVAVIDGGITFPLEMSWDLPKLDDKDKKEAQEKQKKEFDDLIKRLEATGINGVEFECQGEFVKKSFKFRITTVPQPTEVGKKRIKDNGG